MVARHYGRRCGNAFALCRVVENMANEVAPRLVVLGRRFYTYRHKDSAVIKSVLVYHGSHTQCWKGAWACREGEGHSPHLKCLFPRPVAFLVAL